MLAWSREGMVVFVRCDRIEAGQLFTSGSYLWPWEDGRRVVVVIAGSIVPYCCRGVDGESTTII